MSSHQAPELGSRVAVQDRSESGTVNTSPFDDTTCVLTVPPEKYGPRDRTETSPTLYLLESLDNAAPPATWPIRTTFFTNTCAAFRLKRHLVPLLEQSAVAWRAHDRSAETSMASQRSFMEATVE